MGIRRRSLLVAVEVGTTVTLVALLWLVTAQWSSTYVPSFGTVLADFRQTWLFSHVGSDLLPSMRRLLVGYLAGVGAGSVIGVAFGSSRLLRLTFRPVAVFFRAVPPVVLLPVALLLFGSGDAEKIFLIAFMCVWPILLNAEDGVAGIDATVRDAARAYGIRGWRRLWYVTLPAILPRVFAGMRISLSFAVLLLVVAELYGSLNGVGHVVQVEANSYDIAQMWSGVLMLGLIGYVLNMILLWAEHHVIRWHQMRRRDAA